MYVLYHGENHSKIHAIDPEICPFENTCYVQVTPISHGIQMKFVWTVDI